VSARAPFVECEGASAGGVLLPARRGGFGLTSGTILRISGRDRRVSVADLRVSSDRRFGRGAEDADSNRRGAGVDTRGAGDADSKRRAGGVETRGAGDDARGAGDVDSIRRGGGENVRGVSTRFAAGADRWTAGGGLEVRDGDENRGADVSRDGDGRNSEARPRSALDRDVPLACRSRSDPPLPEGFLASAARVARPRVAAASAARMSLERTAQRRQRFAQWVIVGSMNLGRGDGTC
jgi:hypothetical protein